jgi:hypothetical protein
MKEGDSIIVSVRRQAHTIGEWVVQEERGHYCGVRVEPDGTEWFEWFIYIEDGCTDAARMEDIVGIRLVSSDEHAT